MLVSFYLFFFLLRSALHITPVPYLHILVLSYNEASKMLGYTHMHSGSLPLHQNTQIPFGCYNRKDDRVERAACT